MTHLTISDARQRLADTVNRVAYTRERIILQKRGKSVAALVPIEDLELLEQIEDRLDLEAAREALKEPGELPYEEVRRRLGL